MTGTARPTSKTTPRARGGLLGLLALAAFAACPACKRDGDPARVTQNDAAPAAASAQPEAQKRPATTSASIALGNLDAEIEGRTKANIPSPAATRTIVELVLARGQFLAKVADYELADALSAKLVAESPKSPDAHLARASASSALHRFDDAAAELAKAKELGADAAAVDAARTSILLARGQIDEAKAAHGSRPPEERLAADIATSAILAARMQQHAEAERLFELARARYRDVSPFSFAWMDFQRASALEAAGDAKRATAYYAEACEVLPPYAHAAVHLAKTEPAERAIARLSALRETSDDADVLAALAEAHARAGHADEATKIRDEARARYDELVAKHPEAFWDHAARFYLTTGLDKRRALELAKKNAALRPTDEAVDLWSAAAAGADDRAELCAAAVVMSKLPYAAEDKRRLAAATLGGCGDAARPR